MPTVVVNRRLEIADVYIGRGSPWGNPFSHVPSGFNTIRVATRTDAIARYRDWIQTQPQLLARIKAGELRSKILGCYCSPLACHGDVLAELSNQLFPND